MRGTEVDAGLPAELATGQAFHTLQLAVMTRSTTCPHCGYDALAQDARTCPKCKAVLEQPAAPVATVKSEMHIGTVEDGRVTGVQIGDIRGDVAIDSNVTIEHYITNVGQLFQTIVRNPAEWQDALYRFLSANRRGMLLLLPLQVVLATLYFHLRNLYLIPLWEWGLAAGLLLVAVWNGCVWLWLDRGKSQLTLAAVAAMAFAGVTGVQAWRIVAPAHFSPRTFGILVAELGSGGNYERTSITEEISGQVYENLCNAIRSEFADQASSDPCADDRLAKPNSIAIRRIGIIADSDTARRIGRAFGANIVVWGQVLEGQKDLTTVRFYVEQTLDLAGNPEHPSILYVTATSADISVPEMDLQSDPLVLKQVVARQSSLISSFSFGVAQFLLAKNYPEAIRYFSLADKQLSSLADKQLSKGQIVASPAGQGLVHFYLARSYVAMGRLDEGLTWLKRSYDNNREDPGVALELGHVYASLGNEIDRDRYFSEALHLANTWLEQHPGDSAALYDRGVAYQVLGQPELAQHDFQTVVNQAPDFFAAYVNLSWAATKLGQFDDAESALQSAIAVAKRRGMSAAAAQLTLGLMLEQAGRKSEARTAFEAAIAAEPDSYGSYEVYGRFLESLGETDAAEMAYESMLRVAERKSWPLGAAHTKMAEFQRRQRLFEDAVKHYHQAILYGGGNDALLHTELAETYVDLDDLPSAVQEHERAVKLAANEAHDYYSFTSYGDTLYRLGDLQGAARMYKEALDRQPTIAATYLNLGSIYQRLGRYDEAKSVYQQLLNPSIFSAEERATAHARLNALELELQPGNGASHQ